MKADETTKVVPQANLDLLEEILFINYELLRILSLLLVPYCPDTANTMLSVVSDDLNSSSSFESQLEFDLGRVIDI